MPDARIASSITEIGREAWDRLFVGELEAYDYLLTVERAGLSGFEYRYLVIEEAGRVLAGAPMFVTAYPLDTTLAAAGRRIVEGARRVFPGLLTLRLACLGSPCTEALPLGFAADVDEARKPELLRLLLDAFEAEAGRSRCGLMGLKDASEDQYPLWDTVAATRGYRRIAGLPVAHLDISFDSVDAYLAGRSAATRKDMRRKLRNRAKVRVEWRNDLDGVLDRVMELYRQTLERADMTFEDLTPAYFTGLSETMGGRVQYVLYWSGEELLAMNLLLSGDDVLVDKFFVMDGEGGRALDLYFLSWFANIEHCLQNGIGRYHAGAAAYEVKRRLGSTLTGMGLYFRHRNRALNGVLNLAAPLFAADTGVKAAA